MSAEHNEARRVCVCVCAHEENTKNQRQKLTSVYHCRRALKLKQHNIYKNNDNNTSTVTKMVTPMLQIYAEKKCVEQQQQLQQHTQTARL